MKEGGGKGGARDLRGKKGKGRREEEGIRREEEVGSRKGGGRDKWGGLEGGGNKEGNGRKEEGKERERFGRKGQCHVDLEALATLYGMEIPGSNGQEQEQPGIHRPQHGYRLAPLSPSPPIAHLAGLNVFGSKSLDDIQGRLSSSRK